MLTFSLRQINIHTFSIHLSIVSNEYQSTFEFCKNGLQYLILMKDSIRVIFKCFCLQLIQKKSVSIFSQKIKTYLHYAEIVASNGL